MQWYDYSSMARDTGATVLGSAVPVGDDGGRVGEARHARDGGLHLPADHRAWCGQRERLRRLGRQHHRDRRGAGARIAHVDLRAIDHAQVRLVGVALLDERYRARTPAQGVAARARGARGSARTARQLVVVGHVVGVADQERAAARPDQRRSRNATIASRVKLRRCSSGPSTGRPSGWSPNAARSIRCSATTAGWSLARLISWITTPRSRSSSSASMRGRPAKSVSRSIAGRGASARG